MIKKKNSILFRITALTLKHADMALMKGKKNGRTQSVEYSKEMSL